MKYTTFLVIAPLLLGACDTTQSVMQPDLAPGYAANKTTTEFDDPFDKVLPNACVEGELVAFTGTLHTTITEKFRDNGSVVLEFETNPVGVTGTGFPSGAAYTASGSTSETIKIKVNTAFSFKTTNTVKVKSSASGYDFTVVETAWLSVSKDGEFKKDSSSFDVKCQGQSGK